MREVIAAPLPRIAEPLSDAAERKASRRSPGHGGPRKMRAPLSTGDTIALTN